MKKIVVKKGAKKTSTKKDAWPFVVKRSAPGAGFGLFTTVPIKKGSFVIEYTGKKIPTKVADTITTRYLFQIDEKWTIDGSGRENIARYINHSCVPNCETEIDEKDRIVVNAIKDIMAGEELTYDYGTEYFDQFLKGKCTCPAKKHGGGPV